jgi:hypothetical protein
MEEMLLWSAKVGPSLRRFIKLACGVALLWQHLPLLLRLVLLTQRSVQLWLGTRAANLPAIFSCGEH